MRLKKSLAKLIAWERTCRVATASAAGAPNPGPAANSRLDARPALMRRSSAIVSSNPFPRQRTLITASGEGGERQPLGGAHPVLELGGVRTRQLRRQIAPARELVRGIDAHDAVEAPGPRDEAPVELLGVVRGGHVQHVVDLALAVEQREHLLVAVRGDDRVDVLEDGDHRPYGP